MTRRVIIRTTLTLLVAVVFATGLGAQRPRDVTFFAVADPQINIPRWGVEGTRHTIALMNATPGTPDAFGRPIDTPRGVIIAGDLVDDVKNRENWELYKQFFDPAGSALLRFPVFEGAGNHDLDTRQAVGTFTYVQDEIIARINRLPIPVTRDTLGYHYSWDWDDVHMVNLHVFPGTTPRPVYDREAPWNDPKGALAFLEQDLRARVGRSGRPVIVYWHYGLRGWGLEKWWTPDDLEALARVLRPYNIALLIHGHEHRYEHYQWQGHEVVMAPSTQYDPDPAQGTSVATPKGFLVIRLAGSTLEVGYRTPDGWKDSWKKGF